MLFSGLEILGRRSKLKFLDHAFLYSGEGIVAFNISLRSTKFVTRSTVIAVACGARARSSHSTAAGVVLQNLKPHTKLCILKNGLRMWCRSQVFSFYCRRGLEDMYIADKEGASR